MPVTVGPLLIGLPIADRARSHAFYREALDLEAVGPLGDDGIPEPLRFRLTDATDLMLIPSGGFGWVIGDRAVAPAGTTECTLGIQAASEAEVDGIVARARAAGAAVTAEPAARPWGYVGSFTDPDGHLWLVTAS